MVLVLCCCRAAAAFVCLLLLYADGVSVVLLSCGCCFRVPVVVVRLLLSCVVLLSYACYVPVVVVRLLLSCGCCCRAAAAVVRLLLSCGCCCRAAAAVVRLLLSCACCCRMPVVCLLLLCACCCRAPCWLCWCPVCVLFASSLRPVGSVLMVGCCRAAAAVVRLLFGCLYVFFEVPCFSCLDYV